MFRVTTHPAAIIGGTAVLILAFLMPPSIAHTDSFSIRNQRETSLPDGAVDLTVSDDGRWIFVLTNGGSVNVFDSSGSRIQVFEVGKGYDTIDYNSAGNQLYLGNSGNRSLKTITLEMIIDLDYRGSPVKGPPEAGVTIAFFDDFQ